MANNSTQIAISKLEEIQNSIIFESEDDEAAVDYYGHIESVIDLLKEDKISIAGAAGSLGIFEARLR